jgi:predicted cation transporter
MFVGLGIILIMVLVLPFVVKKVEHNLEFFLFVMGFSSTIVSGVFNTQLLVEIMENKLIYFITFAVLVAGLLFMLLKNRIKGLINSILKVIPLKVFVFLLIVILGLASSVITAIISALLLVEIVNALPIKRKDKIEVVIFACFSIGLGAVLTPVGEPLSTIVISKLNENFWYLANNLGIYIISGVLLMGIAGALMVERGKQKNNPNFKDYDKNHKDDVYFLDSDEEEGNETYKEVFIRAFKIFIFIFALELLGAGFKPLIDTYIINLDSRLLYFINMISAILDNATLAAAEISIKMELVQIKAVLMGLLISGGMLIPGNIPNIISAHKLKISSREWAKIGLPVGSALMLIYFVVIFIL